MVNLHEQSGIPEIPKHIKILCICEHGNSRSKYLARSIAALGYEHTRILGIRDATISRSEKMRTINEHEVIVCASGTTRAEVDKLTRDVNFKLKVGIQLLI
jgi:hypothetical protein